ncbi:unnamed protein product [Sphenostylis stenocarpa]|uniref:PWI domain-containing protein n=1 Tax=Sphenostylis stenocarpa TaxID=92480 RepID=A0AA86RX52_9FABA|nr:unnamed protein product [Sphenostylis stenocarpa]
MSNFAHPQANINNNRENRTVFAYARDDFVIVSVQLGHASSRVKPKFCSESTFLRLWILAPNLRHTLFSAFGDVWHQKMSGGFFRVSIATPLSLELTFSPGTSADQDTRFSNKQAKLMKSQKFPPELEHLVDMTKVNMEVIKPWITRRVTELLGFEDEVLINFIHSLLDAKEVNGKEVQIQITGFMEKNTGKFMKELWTLLLSAQKNASGVPQQFLDAKEEELLKKKAENDKIASEIQRKKDKEGREIMEERLKKMDGGFDSKDNDTASAPTSKPRDSGYDRDGKEPDKRNGFRARSSFHFTSSRLTYKVNEQIIFKFPKLFRW